MKMKKALLAIFMAAAMCFSTACANNTGSTASDAGTSGTAANSDIKVGFVYIGKINDEGYTQAHDKGRLALEEMGIQTAYIEEVPETVADCSSAIQSLIDKGCNVVYTTSFGFMDATVEMAAKYPDVKFAHCSGYKTADNLSTYFGKVYQARYLSGIAAGMKTAVNKIGYVAAKPIPEVIRGINAFTLGVQSVNPEATVEVIFTDTWYDPATEKQAALELLNKGVDVIAQHQDTTAPQVAAEEKGAFCIGYNVATPNAAPKAYLTAPLFNWPTFYVDDVQKIIDGTWTSRAYWEGLAANMTSLDTLTDLCADGTAEKVDAAKAAIISGELEPFTGPIKNQNGEVVVAEGTKMTDDEIWNMSWFVEGVIGTIPQ